MRCPCPTSSVSTSAPPTRRRRSTATDARRPSTSACAPRPSRRSCSSRDDETILTGEAASRRGVGDPGRVAREFKRRVGDTTPILLGGSPYSADGLMSQLLRWVVDAVTEREGERPAGVAVAFPANWGPYKQELLRQSISRADLDHVVTITEPEAAVMYYASQERVEPGSVIAVYDLGGGTFDAAVVRKTPDGVELLGTPEGIERLGGVDFDEAVFAHVASALGGALNQLDPDDPAAMAAVLRLRSECVEAKEALSADTEASIPVLLPNLVDRGAPDPSRARGDDPPAARRLVDGDAPGVALGRRRGRRADGRAARRRVVSHPARRPAGQRRARPTGRRRRPPQARRGARCRPGGGGRSRPRRRRHRPAVRRLDRRAADRARCRCCSCRRGGIGSADATARSRRATDGAGADPGRLDHLRGSPHRDDRRGRPARWIGRRLRGAGPPRRTGPDGTRRCVTAAGATDDVPPGQRWRSASLTGRSDPRWGAGRGGDRRTGRRLHHPWRRRRWRRPGC